MDEDDKRLQAKVNALLGSAMGDSSQLAGLNSASLKQLLNK